MSFIRRWWLFCPRSGCDYTSPTRADDQQLRYIIDRMCPRCGKVGVDAVVRS